MPLSGSIASMLAFRDFRELKIYLVVLSLCIDIVLECVDILLINTMNFSHCGIFSHIYI